MPFWNTADRDDPCMLRQLPFAVWAYLRKAAQESIGTGRQE